MKGPQECAPIVHVIHLIELSNSSTRISCTLYMDMNIVYACIDVYQIWTKAASTSYLTHKMSEKNW